MACERGISDSLPSVSYTHLDVYKRQLQYKPDLIFIEFAVNGGYPDGMEGMIRKIIKENPHTDICLIYTIYTNQATVYQKGDVPQVIKRLADIATYYQLPSICLLYTSRCV